MPISISPYALTSLERVKSRLSIEMSDTSLDEDLKARINSATRAIEKYTKRNFIARDYVEERHKGTDEQELLTYHFPINSISEILYIYSYRDAFQRLDDEEYFIHPLKYTVVRERGWSKFGFGHYLSRSDLPYYNIQISYNAGFDNIDNYEISDLVDATTDMIADLVSIDETGGQGLRKYRVDDINIEWKTDTDKRIMRVINSYKKKVF